MFCTRHCSRGAAGAFGADTSMEIWDLVGTSGSRLGTTGGSWAEVGDRALPIINSQSIRARSHPAFSFFFAGGKVYKHSANISLLVKSLPSPHRPLSPGAAFAGAHMRRSLWKQRSAVTVQAGALLPAAVPRQLLPHAKPAATSSTGHICRGQAGLPLAPERPQPRDGGNKHPRRARIPPGCAGRCSHALPAMEAPVPVLLLLGKSWWP